MSSFSGKKKKQEHLNPPGVALTTDGKRASEESDYSSETNSTERLKGRCFTPCGISSSYSLSQSADRSFIEISAHHTGCNKRDMLCQDHNKCMGKTNEEQKLEGKRKRKSAPTNVFQRCALFIYSHDITGEFSCFSFTEGFSNHFAVSPPQKKKAWLQKAWRVNKTAILFLIKGFGGIEESHHPLGNMSGVEVKFRQKCRHKNTLHHKNKMTKAVKPVHSDWKYVFHSFCFILSEGASSTHSCAIIQGPSC